MRSPTPPSCPQRRKPCPRIDGLAPRGALDPELLSGALVGTRSDAIKLLCFLALGTDSNNFFTFRLSPPGRHVRVPWGRVSAGTRYGSHLPSHHPSSTHHPQIMNSTARGPSSVDHSLLSDFLFFIPFSLIIIIIIIIALTRDVPTHSLKK